MLEHQRLTKEKTIRRVFRECIIQGESTCISLCKSLSLSKPTVNEVLSYLEGEGLIVSNGYIEGDVGRNPRKWSVNKSPWLTLAIDIDVKTVRLGLVNLCGELESLATVEEDLVGDGFVARLYSIIENYLSTIASKTKRQIKYCFISTPANVSFDRKTIVYATNMQIENVSILELEKKLNMPVFLENEANCGVLLECHSNRRLNNTMLYISISDKGVGGGYIVDGRLKKGENRRGGEIGHFTIDINGRECSCGNYGCFECYTANEPLLELLAEHGFVYNNIDDALLDKSNDEVIKKYCHYLGRGIRGLSAILDPNQIIIGGKIAKYKNRIEHYIDQEVFLNNHFMTNKIDICYSKYGELSSLIGVGILSFFPMIYDEDVYG